MSDSNFTTSLARILKNGHSVGLGFLVSSRHILTCAHVVADTLSIDRNTPELPREKIYLDFPLVRNHPRLSAFVIKWYPVKENTSLAEIEDIAVLELTSEHGLPKNIHPGVLSDIDTFHDRRVWIFGIPRGKDIGTWVRGELKGPVRTGWIEISHEPGQGVVDHGFSGSPVWDNKEKAAVGMTVGIHRTRAETLAYMIPVSTLTDAWPDLARHSRPLNPYRGLEAFREQDADYFFGREDTVRDLIEKVRENAFVALTGPSGSGKSSLVYAGLIPALRKEENWLIADLRPKDIPFTNLARVMISLLHEDKQKQADEFESFLDKLETGKISIFSVIQPVLQANPGKRLLLIIDQFEELYTMNQDKDLQQRFTDRFLKAVQVQGQTPDFTLLITLRADFMGQAVKYDPFAEIMDNCSNKILKSMDQAGLVESIVRPAENMGVELQKGLAERILQDLGKEPGNLPLLEFALKELWKKQLFRRMTHDGYEKIGGVKKALADYADEVYASFKNEDDKDKLRRIFVQLVRPGEGTEDTKQLATIDQVHPENWALVKELADARLVVTGYDDKETVEIVHEALIHHWQLLQGWVKEHREFRLWQNGLRQSIKVWEKTNKDEGSLLRGARLADAREKLDEHADILSADEQDYISGSIAIHEREVKAQENARREQELLQQRISRILGIFLTVALVLAAVLSLKWQEAFHQRQIAEQRGKELENQKEKAELERDQLALALGYTNKGMMYWNLGQYKNALDFYKNALKINRKIGYPREEAANLANIGMVYDYLGQYPNALKSYEYALKIHREIQNRRGESEDLSNIGNVYTDMCQYQKALEYYEQALRIDREIGNQEGEAKNKGNIGIVCLELSQYEKALEYFRQALPSTQGIGNKRKERDKLRGYDEMLELLIALHAKYPLKGYDRKSLEVFQLRQGRIFTEQIRKTVPRNFAETPEVISREKAEPEIQSATISELQEKILNSHEVMLVYNITENTTYLWVISKDQFGFYPIEVSKEAFAKKMNKFGIYMSSVPKAEKMGLPELRIKDIMKKSEDRLNRNGHVLYKLLVPEKARPVISKAKTLYIIPCSLLCHMPFETLVNQIDAEGFHYLVEAYSIVYLPSVAVLRTLRETQQSKKEKPKYQLLVFANPVYGTKEEPCINMSEVKKDLFPLSEMRKEDYKELCELPNTEEEVKEINAILKAPGNSLQLREKASRSNILKMNESGKLDDYRYVFFSCHGIMPGKINNLVTQPSLLLSHPDLETDTEGCLTMADVFGLRLNADIVTLSVGRGKVEFKGEGLTGFTRAFMYAGASAVSISLWELEAGSAKTLNVGFYRNIKKGMTRAEALREIKLRMIRGEEGETYKHPFFWAPLVILGDGS